MFEAGAESLPHPLVRQAGTEASVNTFRDYATISVLLHLQLWFV